MFQQAMVSSKISKTLWHKVDVINPQSAYGRPGHRVKAEFSRATPKTRLLYVPHGFAATGKNFAKTMTKFAIRCEGEVKVVNDQVGQPTSASDIAKQFVELGLSNSPIGFNHGTYSGQTTWYEFAQEISKLAYTDVGRVCPLSSSEYLSPAKRPSYSVLSHDAWANASINPLIDWRIALSHAMPAIICAVKE